MDADALLEKVRSIALDLPHATERMSHGGPAWFVGKAPQFAMFTDHHHGADWIAIWAACPDGARQPLLEAQPDTYFVPPYVGTRGWIGVRLDARTDWDVVADLLADAWDVVAKPAQRREPDER